MSPLRRVCPYHQFQPERTSIDDPTPLHSYNCLHKRKDKTIVDFVGFEYFLFQFKSNKKVKVPIPIVIKR